MGGGLLNLVMDGSANVLLNGNPSKSFFKTSYAKYTNFGLQKFRIDVDGRKQLNISEKSTFKFKVPRYADLLMDTYFVVTLPNIWSPIYGIRKDATFSDVSNCQPYEFKWIENIGCNLINRVTYYLNENIIQEFTGQYLYNMVQRDFSNDKKELFDKMTGNVAELNDPANFSNRNGSYPNASYNGISDISWATGIEPSIRGRQLYIPLNIWSTLSSKVALPLVSMQYSTLYIEIECRPVEDLFVIRNIDYFLNQVTDPSFSDPNSNNCTAVPAPYIHANQEVQHYHFHYFLKEPPPGTHAIQGNSSNITENNHYNPIQVDWAADIHLISTYAFLGNDEVRKFANECQSYLIREVHEQTLYNLVGPYKRIIQSQGLVSSWMWFFQRSDVRDRNEWSNYTNWAYENQVPCPITKLAKYARSKHGKKPYPVTCPAACPPVDKSYSLYYTPDTYIENTKMIMTMWGFTLDGKVREEILRDGLELYVEKYVRTAGNAKEGLYCYNFCLNTDPFQYQPSGAMNLSMFNTLEWEFNTIKPESATSASVSVTCDASGTPQDPLPTSSDVEYWKNFKYSYNIHIMEERYNILVCNNGVGNLALSRSI